MTQREAREGEGAKAGCVFEAPVVLHTFKYARTADRHLSANLALHLIRRVDHETSVVIDNCVHAATYHRDALALRLLPNIFGEEMCECK